MAEPKEVFVKEDIPVIIAGIENFLEWMFLAIITKRDVNKIPEKLSELEPKNHCRNDNSILSLEVRRLAEKCFDEWKFFASNASEYQRNVLYFYFEPADGIPQITRLMPPEALPLSMRNIPKTIENEFRSLIKDIAYFPSCLRSLSLNCLTQEDKNILEKKIISLIYDIFLSSYIPIKNPSTGSPAAVAPPQQFMEETRRRRMRETMTGEYGPGGGFAGGFLGGALLGGLLGASLASTY